MKSRSRHLESHRKSGAGWMVRCTKSRNAPQLDSTQVRFMEDERAVGQVQVAPGSTILLLLVPQVPKEFCRGWPVPCIIPALSSVRLPQAQDWRKVQGTTLTDASSRGTVRPEPGPFPSRGGVYASRIVLEWFVVSIHIGSSGGAAVCNWS